MQKILDSQSLELQWAKKLHSLLLREQLVDRSRLKVLEMYLVRSLGEGGWPSHGHGSGDTW